MLHFDHVEGIVGPAPFLVKLHISGQTFESYLQTELDAEQGSCQLSSFVSCLSHVVLLLVLVWFLVC